MRRQQDKKNSYLRIISTPRLAASRFRSLSPSVSPKPQHLRHSSDITNFLRFGTPSDTIVHVPISVARLNSKAQQDLTKRSYQFETLLHPHQQTVVSTPLLPETEECINAIKSVRIPIKNFDNVVHSRRAFCISPSEFSDADRIRSDILRRVRSTAALNSKASLVPKEPKGFLRSTVSARDSVQTLIETAKSHSTFEAYNSEYAQRYFEAVKQRDTAEVGRLLAMEKKLVNVKDFTGQTALHWAAKRNDLEMVKVLKAAGADVNATDMTMRTPLFVAARKDFSSIVSFLLENGADRKLTSLSGLAPADVARSGSFTHSLLARRTQNANVVVNLLLHSMKRKTHKPQKDS